MILIDGSRGEGGGQILRTALAMAALSGRETSVERIRAGRSQPGLRPQHLTAVRAVAALCDAGLSGDMLGSQAVTIKPSRPAVPGDFAFDVTEAAERGSAGSVGLILQTLLLPLALADGDSRITLRGGTHVPWAPSISYIERVFLPVVALMGVEAEIELVQWGFYPAGGGTVHVHVRGQGQALDSISLTERGKLRHVNGLAVVTNLPSHIPQRMANRTRNVLAGVDIEANVEARRLRGAGPGAGLFLFAEYEDIVAGFTSYGRKGLPAERVAEAACKDLLTHHRSGTPVDPHLADQLVPFMAVASGESHAVTSEITDHLLSNGEVVEEFVNCRIDVTTQRGQTGALRVRGAGLNGAGG